MLFLIYCRWNALAVCNRDPSCVMAAMEELARHSVALTLTAAKIIGFLLERRSLDLLLLDWVYWPVDRVVREDTDQEVINFSKRGFQPSSQYFTASTAQHSGFRRSYSSTQNFPPSKLGVASLHLGCHLFFWDLKCLLGAWSLFEVWGRGRHQLQKLNLHWLFIRFF